MIAPVVPQILDVSSRYLTHHLSVSFPTEAGSKLHSCSYAHLFHFEKKKKKSATLYHGSYVDRNQSIFLFCFFLFVKLSHGNLDQLSKTKKKKKPPPNIKIRHTWPPANSSIFLPLPETQERGTKGTKKRDGKSGGRKSKSKEDTQDIKC